MSRDQEFEKIMETLFEMSRYITAVSYTHLDVYKRQI